MAGWWQLKYFLFSQLPGEMIQFDYIILFRWVETTNQLIAYRILIGTSSFSDLGMSNVKSVQIFVILLISEKYCSDPCHTKKGIYT